MGNVFEDLFANDAAKRSTPELASAWRLFDIIAERDPAAIGSKDAALETFRDCLNTVRTPRPGADDDRSPF